MPSSVSPRCEFEEPFLAALRRNAAELTALEGRTPAPPEPAW